MSCCVGTGAREVAVHMTDGAGGEPEVSDSLKAFGEVIKAFRKRARLTQEEFAPRVRYSLPTVASIEQGRRFPPADFVDRAEEVLDGFGALKGAARHLSRRAGELVQAVGATGGGGGHPLDVRMPSDPWPVTDQGIRASRNGERAACKGCRAGRPTGQRPHGACRTAATKSTHRIELHHRASAARTAYGWRRGDMRADRPPDPASSPVQRRAADHTLRQPDHAGFDGPLMMLETPEHRWFGYAEGNVAVC